MMAFTGIRRIEEAHVRKASRTDRAAEALKEILLQNKAVISDGTTALKAVQIGSDSAKAGTPVIFIAVLNTSPRSPYSGSDSSVSIRFRLRCAVRKLKTRNAFRFVYKFGDAVAAVLRGQGEIGDDDGMLWRVLRVINMTPGALTKGGAAAIEIDLEVGDR